VRELLGPLGVLGNHVVIRRDDGPCVLVAHLRRGSLRVASGDRVESGTTIGECGNSGNSSEPHVHVQAMDRPSVWIAAGLPLLIDGREPPANGSRLVTPSAGDRPDGASRS
jgi:murein DD-endopeptidase MepM/ murein hydrolase activator NlpD